MDATYDGKAVLTRSAMPRISIEPRGARFDVLIGGCSVRRCDDEMDAHHWGKHAFEAVNRGLFTPNEVAEGMAELCRQATAFNLHT